MIYFWGTWWENLCWPYMGESYGERNVEFPSELGQLTDFRGADDNVPVWHTREQVGILKTWDPDADITCVHLPHDAAVRCGVKRFFCFS